jgi:hypothetical protein
MYAQFLVWVGEEDHLRIISMQEGGHVGEVYTRLVQGVQVQLPGSTRGGGVRQARPGGPGTPTREHTWGRCTPDSSRGSRYTYQGAHVGEVYARLVQGVKVHIPGSTYGGDIHQARPGGPGTTTRADTWGSCTPGSSRGSRYTC